MCDSGAGIISAVYEACTRITLRNVESSVRMRVDRHVRGVIEETFHAALPRALPIQTLRIRCKTIKVPL